MNYDDAFAQSSDRAPFSNGTEGFAWESNWCDRCLRDAPFRNGLKGATGCPLLLVAITGRTPAEWLDGPRDEHGRYSMADQYVCVEFKAPGGGGGGGEPRPRPEPPQDGLFPRPARAVRMLSPTPPDAPGSYRPAPAPVAVPAVVCQPATSPPPAVGADCGGRRQ